MRFTALFYLFFCYSTHYKEFEIVQFFTHKSWKNVFCWQQHSLPFSISLSLALIRSARCVFNFYETERAYQSVICRVSGTFQCRATDLGEKWFTGKKAWPASRKEVLNSTMWMILSRYFNRTRFPALRWDNWGIIYMKSALMSIILRWNWRFFNFIQNLLILP